nr:hypothetical protein [Bacillus velezensis]
MPPQPFIEKGGKEGRYAVELMERILTAPIK